MKDGDTTFVDLSHVKRGRPVMFDRVWQSDWKQKRKDKMHSLVSRFHNGDDSVVPLLAELGIKARRPTGGK